MTTSSLTALAKTILENATQIEDYFKQQGLLQPSFDEDASPELPLAADMQQVRLKAVDAALELRDLLTDPSSLFKGYYSNVALQTIYKYGIAQQVPIHDEISYQDLAKIVKLPEQELRRVVRFAIVHYRVFQEKKPGLIGHTAASRCLVEDPDQMASLGFVFDECFQATAHTVEAMQKYQDRLPTQTGWAIANNTDMTMWAYHAQHPELATRAAGAMSAFTKSISFDTEGLIRGFDWSSISANEGLFVDVGGAGGHVAFDILRAIPGIRAVVQDTAPVIAKAKYAVPADVTNRVSLQVHNFFDPQTVTADVYLIRHIFHDWPDARCIDIIRAMIPALRPDAKILVHELVVPPLGVLPLSSERSLTGVDMMMLSLFNSRERDRESWEQLFKDADARFDVTISQPKGSQMGLVEATWRGGERFN